MVRSIVPWKRLPVAGKQLILSRDEKTYHARERGE